MRSVNTSQHRCGLSDPPRSVISTCPSLLTKYPALTRQQNAGQSKVASQAARAVVVADVALREPLAPCNGLYGRLEALGRVIDPSGSKNTAGC
jgi:hypothetical protein